MSKPRPRSKPELMLDEYWVAEKFIFVYVQNSVEIVRKRGQAWRQSAGVFLTYVAHLMLATGCRLDH